jgi:hypothetical protein
MCGPGQPCTVRCGSRASYGTLDQTRACMNACIQAVFVVVVVAVVTLGQWDPHRCNRSATVSHTPGTAELAATAEQPH